MSSRVHHTGVVALVRQTHLVDLQSPLALVCHKP